MSSPGKALRMGQRMRLLLRAIFVLFVAILFLPALRWQERRRYNNRISSLAMPEDPVFILGHWRSGTTFLHYLMAADPQFGVMTNLWTFYPWLMNAGKKSRLAAVWGRTIPAKRWDNMALSASSAQEEEFALYRLFGGSAYLGWHFPNRLTYYFEKYALLKFDSEAGRSRFGQQYLGLLKRLSAACGGKRLLLKNPPNTGRVSLLLELFPNARFVHLNREPAEVFRSTVRMHEQLIDRFALMPCSTLNLNAFVPAFYRRLTERYEADKTLIPAGNLVEISYEQLIYNPEQTVRDIYDALNLPGFSTALPAFQAFLETQKTFQPAVYQYSPAERLAINQQMKSGKPVATTI